ncbi:sensor domain-containing diguanylate cyclase, partial [Vibrio lentus]|nr:sensor domain-containing diguanylate cyclase [Vibrio lentus]
DKDIVRVKLYDINEQLFASYQVSNTLVPRPNTDELNDIADHQFAISENFIFLLVPVTLDDAVIANLRVTISKETFNTILTNIFKVAAVYLLFLVILG